MDIATMISECGCVSYPGTQSLSGERESLGCLPLSWISPPLQRRCLQKENVTVFCQQMCCWAAVRTLKILTYIRGILRDNNKTINLFQWLIDECLKVWCQNAIHLGVNG